MQTLVMAVTGPMFWAVFVAYAVTVMAALRWWTRRGLDTPDVNRGSDSASLNHNDPYEVSFLAGDVHGAIRAALVALADTGVLTFSPNGVEQPSAPSRPLHPVEQAVLEHAATHKSTDFLYHRPLLRRVAEAMEPTTRRLARAGLLYPYARAGDVPIQVFVGSILIESLAFWQVGHLAARGHVNVLFLMGLGLLLFLVVPLALGSPRGATPHGRQVIKDLKAGMEGWQERLAHPAGVSPHDWALTAGVFGLQALTGTKHQALSTALRRPTTDD
jgi:uncharacterized protein (TIGR04222 family)